MAQNSLSILSISIANFLWNLSLFLGENWKKQSLVLAGLALTYAVFLILSTNLFPWQLFAGKGITLVELIQFPFRFFLYANALLLAVVGVQVSGLSAKMQKIFSGLTVISLLVSVGFLWNQSYKEINGHYYSDTFLQNEFIRLCTVQRKRYELLSILKTWANLSTLLRNQRQTTYQTCQIAQVTSPMKSRIIPTLPIVTK